ncbi:MAG: GldG family protein [Lentisphaerae bacterium]|nr:GldG family protein [Lentisphaerota bacterium]
MKLLLTFRRGLTGFNAGLALALAALVVIMANYLAGYYPLRFELSRARHYGLTTETRNLLRELPPGIRLVAYLSSEHELYRAVQSLLREYEYAAPRLRIEYTDPHRDLGRSKELALQYDLREPNVIVLASGAQRLVVPVTDLADYGETHPAQDRARVPRQFRGEQVLTTALQNLLRQSRARVVYFLAGHGEHQTDNFDPSAGYSIVARAMEKQGLEIKSLDFSAASAVPADAEALVIAGPRRPLAHPEVETIRNYLNDHGRVLLLVNPGVDCGLEKMLELWGVRLGPGYVASSSMAFKQLLVTAYGAHPITAPLKNVGTIFTMPRPVQPLLATFSAALKPADKPRVAVLAASGAEGWAELSANQNPPKFDPGVDQPGAVPVAVAVEKGPVAGLDVELAPTRLVIIGDATLVANGALLAGYNADFFLNSLNWLMEREVPLAIAARAPATIQVAMDFAQLRALAVLVVAGLPGLVILLGLAVWARRRK